MEQHVGNSALEMSSASTVVAGQKALLEHVKVRPFSERAKDGGTTCDTNRAPLVSVQEQFYLYKSDHAYVHLSTTQLLESI